MFEKIYGVCTICGNYIYREEGKRHGDGQLDSEDNPIWLLADVEDMDNLQIVEAETNRTQCGCGK